MQKIRFDIRTALINANKCCHRSPAVFPVVEKFSRVVTIRNIASIIWNREERSGDCYIYFGHMISL